jgi:hypothetical protein
MPLKDSRVFRGLKEYLILESRPSHLIIGAMVVVGAVMNLILPHGWTVWPFVLAFGMLTYINEAVDRSGQGIPPYQVYLLFLAAGAAWIVAIVLLQMINPIVFIIGIGVIVYRVVEAVMKQRERENLIATRKMQGLCLHCGSVYDPNSSVCPSCWEEPNPDAALLRRVAQICHSPADMARARAVLTRAAPSGSASAKEQALIKRHHSAKSSKASPLPKAAKVGPQSSNRNRR